MNCKSTLGLFVLVAFVVMMADAQYGSAPMPSYVEAPYQPPAPPAYQQQPYQAPAYQQPAYQPPPVYQPAPAYKAPSYY